MGALARERRESVGEREKKREIHVRRAWSLEISGYAGVIDVESARENEPGMQWRRRKRLNGVVTIRPSDERKRAAQADVIRKKQFKERGTEFSSRRARLSEISR